MTWVSDVVTFLFPAFETKKAVLGETKRIAQTSVATRWVGQVSKTTRLSNPMLQLQKFPPKC
jgi:hypothetical protein